MANCLFCYKDAGDLDFHQACSKKFFGTAKTPLLELDDRLLQELAGETVQERIAVTGVQPKLSLTLKKAQDGDSRLTIVGLWGEYILKPQHKRFDQMPETEDLTMHLAGVFKINTCAHTLLRATDGSLVYIARRFDRLKNHKLHLEDLCQLSEFLTENKYKGSYEKAGKLILKYCVHSGLDALDYFERVLFSYLTGNNDMHLKNFSLLHTPQGIALSPAYDLLNVTPVHPADKEELALTLNGKKSRIRLRDFVHLAETLGIPPKACQNSFRKFQVKNDEVFRWIDRSYLHDDNKVRYKEIWLQKQQQLFPALQ